MDTLNAYLLHARRVGGIYRVCGYRRMHHACLRSDCYHYDIHGAKSLCSIPVSPRTDARRTLGHHTGLCRCIQDVDKRNHHHSSRADNFLYNLAPYIVILASILSFSCLPFSKGMEVLDFNVGIFFLMAASSIGVVGILLAGWSSNNKYSLIGAMRSGAQMISYELSVGLSILTIVVLTDTMQFSEIVERQADGWFLFKGHIPAMIAFIIYLIAGNAEVNRGPFDLPEAESELTAGYHTEYSGMHFGLFYVAEFVNLFIIAGVAATIFLGGWMPLHIPGLDGFNTVMDYIPGFVWFFAKSFFIVWLLMWIKWTFPRLRIDQILTLEWKYLVPIGLCNLLLMVIIVVFKLHF